MARIQPISTSRVTDAMTRGRLVTQVQNDQLDLFKLQNQLSTGLRIFLPSDDASAAQRAMVLQRTIERKEQSLTNLQGARASLATTESSLNGVNATLNLLKSQALSVVDSIATTTERDAVINAIDEALFELTRVGNATFATNFLLGGAERSTDAYARTESYVEYLGDEASPQTFIDINQLFDQGLSGNDVLGGISSSIRGTNDLNAPLTPQTKLTQLNGGRGADAGGAINLVYSPSSPTQPTESVAIDLTQAKTIEDVARLIEAGAPAASGVTVSIEGGALRIDTADGGVTIGEVGSGSVARELGILSVGASSSTINGADLDPTLRGSTRLDELGGSKARGRIVPPGDNNDLVVTAKSNGADLNGLSVYFQGGASAGSESAVYDAGSNSLTVTIASGESTAAQIAAAINADSGLPITAEVDYRDQTSFPARGTGKVSVPASPTDFAVVVAGGVGGELDFASGLQITNGGETYTIDTSGAETIEGLLGLLNQPEYGLLASVSASGDGIDVRTRRSGADFAIGENGGTTATQLGIRTFTGASRLEDFNHGVGAVKPGENDADTRLQNPFTISVNDNGAPAEYTIDPLGLNTVEDLIQRISDDTGGAITASLAANGNGITLSGTTATRASGSTTLAGDTLTVTADSPGPFGNSPFTIEVVDSGSGGLGASVSGSTIQVDLGGATPDTAAIAGAISTALPGYSAVATPAGASPATVSGTSGPTGFNVSGGVNDAQITLTGSFAERLGFIPAGEESASSTSGTLTSEDRNPHEVDSVFTTLLRMRESLKAGDEEGFERALDGLEADIDKVSFGRAEVGVRLRNLDSVSDRLADEEVTLRAALSDEVDADLVEVISDFTAKQASLQASLQTSASLLNLSIFDYL